MFLFVIGLKMKSAHLWELRSQIFGLGGMQALASPCAADVGEYCFWLFVVSVVRLGLWFCAYFPRYCCDAGVERATRNDRASWAAHDFYFAV